MEYTIETEVNGAVCNVKVFSDAQKIAETNVIGTEQAAREYAEKVFLKDLRRRYGWDISLPGDVAPAKALKVIDGVAVYWYDSDGKPRYRPILDSDEAYDTEGNRLYGYSSDGTVSAVEKAKEIVFKPLEVVDDVKVYCYLLDRTPVFKPMSKELSIGIKGYTFDGKALSGYDDDGNIMYADAVKE